MPSNSPPAFLGFTPATKQFLPFAYSRDMRVWNWPVLPGIPCVITLVFLLIRIDIDLFHACPADGFFSRLGHVVRSDDRESRFRQYFLAEVFVGPFHAHHEGHV